MGELLKFIMLVTAFFSAVAISSYFPPSRAKAKISLGLLIVIILVAYVLLDLGINIIPMENSFIGFLKFAIWIAVLIFPFIYISSALITSVYGQVILKDSYYRKKISRNPIRFLIWREYWPDEWRR
jgi:prepilin signal peptidase PulO-like enzyme (type II secretory pathway)